MVVIANKTVLQRPTETTCKIMLRETLSHVTIKCYKDRNRNQLQDYAEPLWSSEGTTEHMGQTAVTCGMFCILKELAKTKSNII